MLQTEPMADRSGNISRSCLGLDPAFRIVGVDEVGRGPLAGPVVAAAVLIDIARVPDGVTDSKKLTEKKRAFLAPQIQASARSVGIGSASVAEIDSLNIFQASLLAMQRAVQNLDTEANLVLVDGKHVPSLDIEARAIVGGDACIPQIAAASIIAKVVRDRLMIELDAAHPGYGWARNKGYGTAEHLEGLARLGATSHHRTSFAPVRRTLLTPASPTND